MSGECQGWMGRAFGHNYQPVFDTTPPGDVDGIKGSAAGVIAFIEAMSTKKHVHTICTRCGHIIEAKKP